MRRPHPLDSASPVSQIVYDRYRKGSAIMHPLLTVAAGLVVGAMGVRLAKSVKTRESLKSSAATGLETARSGLIQARGGARGAALSGLSVVERSSAGLRRRLETPPDRTEVVDPPASGPVRKKSVSRTRAGGTSKASRKTKPEQAPA